MPTEVEIAWAAGFYEGEGYVGCNGSLSVVIFQNSTWPLERVKRYFGGSIRPSQSGYVLGMTGSLAENFMVAVLPHLSPRRVDQYRDKLARLEAARA